MRSTTLVRRLELRAASARWPRWPARPRPPGQPPPAAPPSPRRAPASPACAQRRQRRRAKLVQRQRGAFRDGHHRHRARCVRREGVAELKRPRHGKGYRRRAASTPNLGRDARLVVPGTVTPTPTGDAQRRARAAARRAPPRARPARRARRTRGADVARDSRDAAGIQRSWDSRTARARGAGSDAEERSARPGARPARGRRPARRSSRAISSAPSRRAPARRAEGRRPPSRRIGSPTASPGPRNRAPPPTQRPSRPPRAPPRTFSPSQVLRLEAAESAFVLGSQAHAPGNHHVHSRGVRGVRWGHARAVHVCVRRALARHAGSLAASSSASRRRARRNARRSARVCPAPTSGKASAPVACGGADVGVRAAADAARAQRVDARRRSGSQPHRAEPVRHATPLGIITAAPRQRLALAPRVAQTCSSTPAARGRRRRGCAGRRRGPLCDRSPFDAFCSQDCEKRGREIAVFGVRHRSSCRSPSAIAARARDLVVLALGAGPGTSGA